MGEHVEAKLVDDIHSHCEKCYELTCCAGTGCQQVYCPHRCGARFHICKLAEHEHLCSQIVVKCINSQHGCPYKLIRKNIGAHLVSCPASVVFCSMRWSREIVTNSTISLDISSSCRVVQIDAALTVMDQRSAQENIQIPLMSISPQCNHTRKEIILENFESTTDSNNETPPLQKDVLAFSMDSNTCALLLGQPNLKLYKFACCGIFHRKEYGSHYLNFHSEIQGECDGWRELRCPLAVYGCAYSIRRLTPRRGILVYNSPLNSFGIAHSDESSCSTYNYNIYFSKNYDSKIGFSRKRFFPEIDVIAEDGRLNRSLESRMLEYLPDVVFEKILDFLDSFSIKNLSSASHSLRDRCARFVENRGVVIEKWEKLPSGDLHKWKVTGYKWLYTNSFHPITQWIFGSNENMSNHLKTCPFNIRVDHNNLQNYLFLFANNFSSS